LAFDGGEWLTAHLDCPTPVPIEEETGWAAEPVWMLLEKRKKIFSPNQESTRAVQACSMVTILTTLSQILHCS